MTWREWFQVFGGILCIIAGFLCLWLFLASDGGWFALAVGLIDLAVGYNALRTFDFGG